MFSITLSASEGQDGPTCDRHQEIISRRRNGQRKTYNFMLRLESDEDRSRSLPCSPSQTESYPHQLRERTQSTLPSHWVSNAITAISREEREQMSGSGTLAQLKRFYSKSNSFEEDLSDRERTQHNHKHKISVAHLWLCRKPRSSALTTTQ
jgi:thioester reductase-like protein